MQIFFQEFWDVFLYYQKSRVIAIHNFSLYQGLDGTEHSSHFTVDHNILPFALLTFPEILPLSILIRLYLQHSDLHLWKVVPSQLCQNGTLRSLTYFPTRPPCRPAPKIAEWPTQDSLCGCFLCKAHCFSLLAGSPIVASQLVPHTEGKGRWKKEVDHTRLVGGRFNKLKNLLTRFVLGGHKMGKSPHPLAKS